MKLPTFIATLACIACSIQQSYAQGEIPVNMYTGTPGITIPLYSLQDHDLSENIALVYSLSDLRLNSNHRWGVGWSLTAGGQVARKVRGLPDDFGAGESRRGWLYDNNYSAILTFPNTSDTQTSTYLDEANDQTYINGLGYLKDTEPDLFTFSVGNVSGSFIFGNDGNIQLIPYQDILIVPTYASPPTDKTITKWTITTNSGVTYVLDQPSTTSYRLTKSGSDPDGIDETQLTAFERDFQYFRYPTSYTTAWNVSTATSPSGATLTYGYTNHTDTSRSAPKRAILFDAQWLGGAVKLSEFTLMSESAIDVTKNVSSISTSTGLSVTIDSLAIKLFDNVRSTTDSFKEFLLTYDGQFLTKVTESDHSHCNQMPPYQMYYNHNEWYPTSTGTWTQNQDAWGFNNGADNPPGRSIPTIYVYTDKPATERYRLYSIPGYGGTPPVVLNGNASRVADPNSITIGTLTRLVYPAGGETDIIFEANRYYDTDAGRDQFGGGLRVKSIAYYSGVDSAPTVVKNFTYNDASGHSTGRLVTRPSFAIPTWQYVVPTKGSNAGYSIQYAGLAGNLKWRDLTILTGWDVSNQETTAGSAIGYSKVTVARPGSGKVVFDYTMPATYGTAATGAGNTDWIPTTTKFARPSNVTMSNITGAEVGGYPTFPNTPYDYERGLLNTKSEYNEAGTLVRTTATTYQYVFAGTQPTAVTGLAYELYAGSTGVFLYGRYNHLANVGKVISTETTTTYDENNAAKHVAEVNQYTYGSSNHRYTTKATRTTPDGTVYGTYMKYVLDYPTTTPGDQQTTMIQQFKTTHRNAVIVEQQNTTKLFGGTEKTITASLLKFAPFSVSRPLLQSTMAFRPSAGVTDFVPSGVTSNLFTNDSRYETIATVNEYSSSYDIPLSATGEDRGTNATLYGFSNRAPVAQVSLAAASAVAFSDFETTNSSSFTITNSFTGTGRTGAYGIYPYATLSKVITKPVNTSKYLLSFWLKNSTSVPINIVVKDASNTTISSNTYTYSLSGSGYQYFVQPVDVSGVSTSTFTIQVTGQGFSAPPGGSSPTLLPMLDDVAFYPDYASISTVTYDMPFGVNASTNSIGITSFATFDGLGRAKYVIDQDHNIRKRLTYNLPGQVTPTLVASISGFGGPYYPNVAYLFSGLPQGSCIAGTSYYEWDFGDGGGYSAPSTSNTSPNHTYTSIANYTLSLRVTNSNYGAPAIQSIPIAIVKPPLAQTTCPGGVQSMDATGIITSSYTCLSGVTTGWVSSTVSVTNTYGATLSYQWQKKDTNVSTWSNVSGGTTTTFPSMKVEKTMHSFQFKCVITANDGRTTDSDVITVSTAIN